MTVLELHNREFERVLPLYREADKSFPLISAVIQGKQRGQIFADERERPCSALIVTNFGFMFYAGAYNQRFDASLLQLLAVGRPIRPNYLLWYSPPHEWQRRLDTQPHLSRRRERMRFHFDIDEVGWLKEPVQIRSGYEVTVLSAALIPKAQRLGLQLESRFWSSDEDLLRNGVGACVVKDNVVISLCYTAAVADGLGEIDVVTDPEFRSSGLGYCAAQELIRECLRRQIIPSWDCFVDNLSSMKLAAKLGFTPLTSYPFYSFNKPITLGEGSTNIPLT
ncbi:MAG TPA: GNAT family N-acetyltransferase [Pyrinomonadaceae bacterium]|nr:GNAT family N-acetyltransferase [Pyrinomonadaceae bacterium]